MMTLLAMSIMASPNYVISGHIKYNLNKSAKTAKVTGFTEELSFGKAKIKESVSQDGVSYKVTAIDSEAFWGSFLEGVTIPNTVKTIGTRAFKNCNLKKLELPNSITIIGAYAFEEAIDKGIDLVIPKNVTIIRQHAFTLCNLKSVTFQGKKLEEIGDYAFSGNNIVNITIPAVDDLGEGVMCGNKKLQTAVVKGNVQILKDQFFNGCVSLKSVTLPATITEVGLYCFHNCASLTSFPKMPNLEIIGESAFAECEGLVTLHDLPESLRFIKKEAFNSCDNLTEVTIPANVGTISEYCFDYCKKINKVIVRGESPKEENGTLIIPWIPDLGTYGFSYSTYMNANLYIPDGMYDAYKSHGEWQCFRHIIDSAATGVENVECVTTSATAGGDVYDMNGRHLLHLEDANVLPTELPHGIYIIHSAGKTRKVAL